MNLNFYSPELSLELLEKGLLFSTPFEVSADHQRQLIDYVLQQGTTLPPEDYDMQPFWVGAGLTRVKDESLLESVPEEHRGWWYYLSRMDRKVEWEWLDLPEARLVQSLLKPLEPYFERFTRVTLVIQIPHRDLPAHRDIVVGDTYENMADEHNTGWGNQRLQFKGKSWYAADIGSFPEEIHRQQGYLNLKIPVSLDAESPGRPFVRVGNERIYYSSNNKMLFLNEALIEHGAAACPFYRGVVFVDGFFHLENFKNLPREPIKVLSVEKEERDPR